MKFASQTQIPPPPPLEPKVTRQLLVGLIIGVIIGATIGAILGWGLGYQSGTQTIQSEYQKLKEEIEYYESNFPPKLGYYVTYKHDIGWSEYYQGYYVQIDVTITNYGLTTAHNVHVYVKVFDQNGDLELESDSEPIDIPNAYTVAWTFYVDIESEDEWIRAEYWIKYDEGEISFTETYRF